VVLNDSIALNLTLLRVLLQTIANTASKPSEIIYNIKNQLHENSMQLRYPAAELRKNYLSDEWDKFNQQLLLFEDEAYKLILDNQSVAANHIRALCHTLRIFSQEPTPSFQKDALDAIEAARANIEQWDLKTILANLSLIVITLGLCLIASSVEYSMKRPNHFRLFTHRPQMENELDQLETTIHRLNGHPN